MATGKWRFVSINNAFNRFMAGHKVFEEEAMRAQEDAAMSEEQYENTRESGEQQYQQQNQFRQ